MASINTGDIVENYYLELELLNETFHLEIRKELKIKEEAEKLLKASINHKTEHDVATILKNCNEKLSKMHMKLSVLHTQAPDDDG